MISRIEWLWKQSEWIDNVNIELNRMKYGGIWSLFLRNVYNELRTRNWVELNSIGLNIVDRRIANRNDQEWVLYVNLMREWGKLIEKIMKMVMIEIDCSKKGWLSESVGDKDRDDLLMELL